jgi:Tfp pilus assembly PilM family ATPase
VNSLLSIDVGSRYIKIISGRPSAGSINVKAAITVPSPKGMIDNGIVTDPELAAEAIRLALDDAGITDSQATAVITSPAIITREIRFPRTSKKNARSIISHEADALLGDGDYYIDYFLQDHHQNGKMRAFIFALPTGIIATYKKMLSLAGLTPFSLDIGPNAIRKLIGSIGILNSIPKEEISIVTDCGYNYMHFTIFLYDKLIYARSIKADLPQHVKEAAEDALETGEGFSDDAFSDLVSGLGDEILKILRFLASSDYKEHVSNVLLCGGLSGVDGLSEALSEYLYTDVSTINARKKLSSLANYREYINALGAQIRL